MSAPPSLKQIDTSQMDDAPEWFRESFLSQLNPFLRTVVALFTGSLSVSDNILAEERDVSFTTGASVAIDSAPFPLVIVPRRVKRPFNVIVTNSAVDGVAPIAAAQPVWGMSENGVKLRLITGLDVNTTYKMRLRFD